MNDCPLLTIYTPTYRRPTFLSRCIASVKEQTDQDIQHLILPDEVGFGIDGMYADVPNHHGEVAGRYVYFLSDDDALADPFVVSGLRTYLEANDYPDAIICKMRINGQVYPIGWEEAPREAHISLSCYIVKREVWFATEFGHRYQGDFDFIDRVWRAGRWRIAWWDRLIAYAQAGPHHGVPEI